MANPKKRNGYTAIANELMTALAVQWGGTAAVVLWVIRNTYGYHRKKCTYTVTRIAKDIKKHQPNVSRSIQRAIEDKMIWVKDGEIGMVKNYHKWFKMIDQNDIDSDQIDNVDQNDHINSATNPYQSVRKNSQIDMDSRRAKERKKERKGGTAPQEIKKELEWGPVPAFCDPKAPAHIQVQNIEDVAIQGRTHPNKHPHFSKMSFKSQDLMERLWDTNQFRRSNGWGPSLTP